MEEEAPSNNDDIEVKLFARLDPSHVEREANQHKSVQRLLEEGCVSTMAHADTQKYAHLQTQRQTSTKTQRHKDTQTHRQAHTECPKVAVDGGALQETERNDASQQLRLT